MAQRTAFARAPANYVNRVFSVTDPIYGAVGDGATDDTAAILRAVAAAVAVKGTLYFPAGTYKSGNIDLTNVSGLNVIGGVGSKINWTGTAAGTDFIGFHLSGACSGVTFEGLTTNGDAVVANRHAGIWADTANGDACSDIRVTGCKITNCVNGVRFNTGNTLFNIRIENCFIDTIVGELSGQGYGICIASGTATSNCSIIGNYIAKTERHAIYLAAGAGVVVANNRIYKHRDGKARAVKTGICVARSRDVVVSSNYLDTCGDIAMSIEPDESAPAQATGNISVVGNVFTNNVAEDLYVGTTDVAAAFVVDGLTITGNAFRRALNANPSVAFQNGLNVTFEANAWTADNAYVAQYSLVVLHAIGGATRTQKVIFRDNTVKLARGGAVNVYFIDFAADVCGTDGIWVTVEDNKITSPVDPVFYLFDAAVTNRTIVIEGVGTYVAGDATPSVANGVRYLFVANGNAVIITDLTGGIDGQEVRLIFKDANTTINRANFVLSVPVFLFVSAQYAVIAFTKCANPAQPYWHEQYRALDS